MSITNIAIKSAKLFRPFTLNIKYKFKNPNVLAQMPEFSDYYLFKFINEPMTNKQGNNFIYNKLDPQMYYQQQIFKNDINKKKLNYESKAVLKDNKNLNFKIKSNSVLPISYGLIMNDLYQTKNSNLEIKTKLDLKEEEEINYIERVDSYYRQLKKLADKNPKNLATLLNNCSSIMRPRFNILGCNNDIPGPFKYFIDDKWMPLDQHSGNEATKHILNKSKNYSTLYFKNLCKAEGGIKIVSQTIFHELLDEINKYCETKGLNPKWIADQNMFRGDHGYCSTITSNSVDTICSYLILNDLKVELSPLEFEKYTNNKNLYENKEYKNKNLFENTNYEKIFTK